MTQSAQKLQQFRTKVYQLLGRAVEIKRWSQFHFYHSPNHAMEIILIQRQGKGLSKKTAKPMWLAWIGQDKLSF